MNRTKKGYNKVPTHDFDASRTYASAEEVPVPQELVDFDPQLPKRIRRKDLVKKVRGKCEAVMWLTGVFFLVYYLDFMHVILEDSRVDRLWFNLGIIAAICNVFCFAYLIVWLPYVEKVSDDVEWDDYCPRVIPTATLIMLFSSLCFIIGLWPIYHVLILPIMFAFFMAAIMSAHFMPSC